MPANPATVTVEIDTTLYSLYNPNTIVKVAAVGKVIENVVAGDFHAGLRWAKRTCTEFMLASPRKVTHHSRLGSLEKEVA